MPTDFFELAWRQTWQVTLLAGAIAGLIFLCGRKRPHFAHTLCLALLLKCLTPPIWSSSVGLFSQIQPPKPVRVAESSLQIVGSYSLHGRAEQSLIDDVSAIVPDDFAFDDESGDASVEPAVAAHDAKSPAGSISWKRLAVNILASCWLAGAAAWLIWTFARSRRCWREINSAICSTPPELLRMLDRLQQQLKIRRRVRLIVSATRIGPAVMGLFRPVIVLPEVIVTGRLAAELEPILAHELVHVRRGDLWWGCLQALASRLWWFHPLVLIVCRGLAREAERCVDEELILELHYDPARYARTLLNVLELKQTLQPVPVFPGMKPVEITSQRLERIMSLRQGSRQRNRLWCWSALVLLLVATLPGQALVAVDELDATGSAELASPVDLIERTERTYEEQELIEMVLAATQSQGNEKESDDSHLNAAPTKRILRNTGAAQISEFSTSGDNRRLVLSTANSKLTIEAGAASDRPSALDFRSKEEQITVIGSGRLEIQFTQILKNAAKPADADMHVQCNEAQITESAVEKNSGGKEMGRLLLFELKGNVNLRLGSTKMVCGKAQLRMAMPSADAASASPTLQLKLSGGVRLQKSPDSEGKQGLSIEAEELTFMMTEFDSKVTKADVAPPKSSKIEMRRSSLVKALAATKAKRDPNRPGGSNELITKTYAVADLVIPPPGNSPLLLPIWPAEPPPTDYRGTVGTGLRFNIPSLAAAPTAIDLAFPVKTSSFDGGAQEGKLSAGAKDQSDDRSPEQKTSAATSAAPPEINFQPLEALIQTKIAPASWETAGGPGMMKPYRTTGSLVIRQTPAVHDEIVDLLAQLRRHMDLQCCLELRLIRFADRKWIQQLKWDKFAEQLSEGISLTPDRVDAIRQLERSLDQRRVISAPKITLFNEQCVEILLPTSPDKSAKPLPVSMGVVVDRDRRGVKLNVACNAASRDRALASARSYRLAADESLLLEIGTEAALAQEIQKTPVLSKVPYVEQLFRDLNSRNDKNESTESLLLLVTPRVIVVEEQEERLGNE